MTTNRKSARMLKVLTRYPNVATKTKREMDKLVNGRLVLKLVKRM